MTHSGSVLAQGMFTYCQSVGVSSAGGDQSCVDVDGDDPGELPISLGSIVIQRHLIIS